MTHVMLDLETLGTGPRAAIIQIGACAFFLDGTEIHPDRVAAHQFEATISAQSSLFAGLETDPSTLHWWRYTALAAARLAVERGAGPLSVALCDFAAWWTSTGVTHLWSNGAAFDVPILESAYRATGRCGRPGRGRAGRARGAEGEDETMMSIERKRYAHFRGARLVTLLAIEVNEGNGIDDPIRRVGYLLHPTTGRLIATLNDDGAPREFAGDGGFMVIGDLPGVER